MAVEVKICGITSGPALAAALRGGARYVGLVFYPPSPRALDAKAAAALARDVPREVAKVGVFVDPADADLLAVLDRVALDFIQLHGRESPERVARVRELTRCRVIKALKIRDRADLVPLAAYAAMTDALLFDAGAPNEPGKLPGGNGLAFDWRLLEGMQIARPWLLSGGLDADNLEVAVRLSGAPAVDVSSGVELRPGQKDPERIRRFLELARSLPTPAPSATSRAS